MKKTEIQKSLEIIKSLNNAITSLENGDTIDNVFSKQEIETLQETYFSELETLIGNDKAQYLWNKVTQYTTENNGEYAPLWKIKEFSWYGEDLTPDHGARQWKQANNVKEATI
jgi:hypothetical protein